MKDRKRPEKHLEKETAERRVRDLTEEIERLKQQIEEHLASINQPPNRNDRET